MPCPVKKVTNSLSEIVLTKTKMEEIPLHIMVPVLSCFESANLLNIALLNKEWSQLLCSEILKPRAIDLETKANRTLIDKAKSWVFHGDWLRAVNLRLSDATHINVKTFFKVSIILQRLGSTEKVNDENLNPIFYRTTRFFDTRQTIIDVSTVDHTLSLLTYLRHVFSQESLYNMDEVAVCVMFLIFSYILIPEISRLILSNSELTKRIHVQICMARRCFYAQLPPDHDKIYNQTLQNIDKVFGTVD